MSSIVRQLLAEKLIDDFYERSVGDEGEGSLSTQQLTEQLKKLLPEEHHELLFHWEAQCNETCSFELRRFADYVAEILLGTAPLQETSG